MSITKPTKPYTFVNLTETADATKVNADFDTVYSAVDDAIDAINAADGSKTSLANRLAVSMNDDGTMKSAITCGNEWINPELSPTYTSTTTFTVTGDQTDIYLQYRRLKITLAGGAVYSEVVSAAYTTSTLVTIADAVLTDPITSVEHGVLTPASESTHSMPVSDFVATIFNDAAATNVRDTLEIPKTIQEAATISSNAGGTVDAITASFTPAPTTLVNGSLYIVRAAGANATTTPTFTPNSGTITAKTIVKEDSVALVAGDIAGADHELILKYNSTLDQWILLNPKPIQKVPRLDHGSKATSFEIDLSLADLHEIEFSATATLTISSSLALDRATVCIKTNNNAVTLAGVDNNTFTPTQAATVQDIAGFVKSHGKITTVGLMDNVATT